MKSNNIPLWALHERRQSTDGEEDAPGVVEEVGRGEPDVEGNGRQRCHCQGEDTEVRGHVA